MKKILAVSGAILTFVGIAMSLSIVYLPFGIVVAIVGCALIFISWKKK